MFRLLCVGCLLAVSLSPSSIFGGRLSKVRQAVRQKSDADEHEDSGYEKSGYTDSDEPADSHGLLPRDRNKVRRKSSETHSRRHHRGHRHGGHGYAGFQLHPLLAFEVNQIERWQPTRLAVSETEPAPLVFVPPKVVEPNPDANAVPHAGSQQKFNGDYGVGSMGPTLQFFLERGFRRGGVDRLGFGLLLIGENDLGVQADWHEYSEELPGGGVDVLRTGDFNLIYRNVESEELQYRLGIGLKWLDDAVSTDFGAHFTVGIDLFPLRPWTISAELDVGTVGDAKLFHGRIVGGATYRHFEFFGGWDYRSFDSVALHGPLLGCRIRF